MKLTRLILSVGLPLLAITLAWAQRNAREMTDGLESAPLWTNPPEFEKDVFTFARARYTVDGRYGRGHTEDRWAIDAPDSDLNFSYRLQQMTSMKVDPSGAFIDLTAKELANHPFIYIVEPGRLTFTDEELPVLRNYLLNGGFLMVDDFWGDQEWMNFSEELKRLFPERDPVDLDMSHPIFHGVFDLKETPQIPGIEWARRGYTYEARRNPGAEEPHYRAIFDDKNRIMVMICHNTDLGDGWEREGENVEYFHKFSEKMAYPLGINIIFYAMTH